MNGALSFSKFGSHWRRPSKRVTVVSTAIEMHKS
jgi:hypothetical protein